MTIFVMALEPIDTRYTGQWFNGLPTMLREQARIRRVGEEVINIAGEQRDAVVTKGAFLNFTATNVWKNTQLNTFTDMMAAGQVKAGDKVLFTDAWHPGIIQVKYMSELLDIPVEIHSMWHAGSYDPQDFLGRKVKDKRWSLAVEKSYYFASDFNYFATEFHRDLFHQEVLGHDGMRSVISGQPHGALVEALRPFAGMPKKNRVLFPHRVAPEKQPEIFRDLAEYLPDVEFIVCQDTKLTKDEYHELLATSKVIFSANLQETLGISAMEGILVGALPMLPNRLSYTEMYEDQFLYPSKWTESWEAYEFHRDNVVAFLNNLLVQYEDINIEAQRHRLLESYLSAGPMVRNLLGK